MKDAELKSIGGDYSTLPGVEFGARKLFPTSRENLSAPSGVKCRSMSL
jgi:hypothetical protein